MKKYHKIFPNQSKNKKRPYNKSRKRRTARKSRKKRTARKSRKRRTARKSKKRRDTRKPRRKHRFSSDNKNNNLNQVNMTNTFKKRRAIGIKDGNKKRFERSYELKAKPVTIEEQVALHVLKNQSARKKYLKLSDAKFRFDFSSRTYNRLVNALLIYSRFDYN